MIVNALMSRAGLSLVIGRAIADAGFFVRLESDRLRKVAEEVTNDLDSEDMEKLRSIDTESWNLLWDFKKKTGMLFGEKYH
jgi:hypothetical protein